MDTSHLFKTCIPVTFLVLSLTISCRPKPISGRDQAELAQVTVNRVPDLDYDSFALSLSSSSDGHFSLPRRLYPAVDGRLDIQVPAGSYALSLELLKGQIIVASSGACPPALRPATYTLKPGPNQIEVPVCPPGGISGPPQPNGPKEPSAGFSVVGEKLLDPSGVPFVMRGINTPHAYYLAESNASLKRVKELGFNTVRIVWCADNLIRSGRCDTKDIHPVAQLEKTLSLVKGERLVAVLNLQNATGSDSLDHLQKMVEYLTRQDVKEVLIAYKDHLLINIANEWYGTWDKTPNYIEGYRQAVKALRAAKLPHVLIVDARGYGQDISSVAEHGPDLVRLDPHLMISAHIYDVFSTPKSVIDVFAMVREKKLPFLVGEFGCSHGAGKPVACETMMSEASRPDSQYGYIAWSLTGNSSSLQDLDVVEVRDWSTLTAWGKTLIHSPSGIKATSREACFFKSPLPCSR